jgi:hypothetical protein
MITHEEQQFIPYEDTILVDTNKLLYWMSDQQVMYYCYGISYPECHRKKLYYGTGNLKLVPSNSNSSPIFNKHP